MIPGLGVEGGVGGVDSLRGSEMCLPMVCRSGEQIYPAVFVRRISK